MSELWGTITLSFCVWGYINLISKKSDAKRWYPSIAILAQLGQLLAGQCVSAMCNGAKNGAWSFEAALACLTIVNIPVFALFIGTFYWIQNYILTKRRFNVLNERKSKESVGTCEAIKYAFTNGHILCIAGLVFMYGFSNVIQELTYKDLFSAQFQWDAAAMSSMKGLETTLIAVVTFVSMLFVGKNVLAIYGWKVTALITPIISVVFGTVFYIIVLFCYIAYEGLYMDKVKDIPAYGWVGSDNTSMELGVIMGLIMNVLIKSLKYSLFDPTKEMAYLPLTSGEKSRAKAIVDIIGARGGKCMGSIINAIVAVEIASVCGSNTTISLFSAFKITSFIFCCVALILWFVSVIYLDFYIKEREKLNMEKKEEADQLEMGNLKKCAGEKSNFDNGINVEKKSINKIRI